MDTDFNMNALAKCASDHSYVNDRDCSMIGEEFKKSNSRHHPSPHQSLMVYGSRTHLIPS